MSPQGQRSGEVVQQARQVEVQRLQVELLRLDLGEIEDVVDQAEQRFAAGAHDLGILALLIVQLRIQQEPGHADDPVHGRVGQELALGGIGQFRLGGHLLGEYGLLF